MVYHFWVTEQNVKQPCVMHPCSPFSNRPNMEEGGFWGTSVHTFIKLGVDNKVLHLLQTGRMDSRLGKGRQARMRSRRCSGSRLHSLWSMWPSMAKLVSSWELWQSLWHFFFLLFLEDDPGNKNTYEIHVRSWSLDQVIERNEFIWVRYFWKSSRVWVIMEYNHNLQSNCMISSIQVFRPDTEKQPRPLAEMMMMKVELLQWHHTTSTLHDTEKGGSLKKILGALSESEWWNLVKKSYHQLYWTPVQHIPWDPMSSPWRHSTFNWSSSCLNSAPLKK